MTKKERTERAKMKKRMQEEEILPPDKKKLNRKKFVGKAREEWDNRDRDYYGWDCYLLQAVWLLLDDVESNTLRVSLEAVGAAKCLKLALRLKAFEDMVKARGDTSYKLREQYDFIRDILEA